MIFSRLPAFERELKQLLKKYRSLEEDLETLQKFLCAYPRGFPPRVFRINGLKVRPEIYKVKHFACKAMKGKGSRSGIRIVYALLDQDQRIEFVEIYYKEKDDTDCDKGRIMAQYK